MLSIVGIKASSISNNYYLKQDGNYYIQNRDNKDLYTWFGKGAGALGLTGAIDIKEHSKTFSGELPDGTKIGKRHPDGTFAGRPGYDLTFSANKDISLMICCTENTELRDNLIHLHHTAVKEAMGYLEHMISARRTANGVTRYETTGNMIAALCTHFNSRANDPDIHTHALLANMTQCSDGKWRALSTDISRQHGIFEIIRDNATLLGHIYQNRMEKGVKELGFDTEHIYKHGMFKIKEFPEDMRQHFSKRREQIVQIARSFANANKHDKKIYSDITKNSRGAKDISNTKDFIKRSQNSMNDYLSSTNDKYKSFDNMIDDIKVKGKNINQTNAFTKEAVKLAIDTISKFTTKLTINHIIEKTFDHSQASLDVKQIQSAIDELKDSHYITQQGKYIETQKNQLDSSRLKLTAKSIQSQLSIVRQPANHKEAMAHLDSLIGEREKKGHKVIVLASNSRLVSDHNQYARNLQKTIWQRLSSIGKLDRALSIQSLANKPHNYNLTSKHTLVIDDAQRTNISTMQSILDIAERTGCHVVLSEFSQGRRSQLAGNALECIRDTGVKNILENTKAARDHCHVNVIECKPLDLINKTKKSVQNAKFSAIIGEANKAGLNNIDIISSTKKDKQQITELLRDGLKGDRSVRVVCHRPIYINDNTNNIKSGMIVKDYIGKGLYSYHKIKRINRDNGMCILEAGPRREKRVTLHNVSSKQIVKEEIIELKDGEQIKLSSNNHIARRLGLEANKSYTFHMLAKDKVALVPHGPKSKTVKTKVSEINGMNIQYDYVKTVSELSKTSKTNKEALVAVPDYGNFTPKLEDIKRSYYTAKLFVSNEKIYNKYASKEAGQLHPSGSQKPMDAVRYAIESLSSRSSTFTLNEVVKKSLDYGSNATSDQIVADLKGKIASGLLACRKETGANIILGTKKALDDEKSIVQTISASKESMSAYMNAESISHKLKNAHLTQGQKAACTMIATTKDQFNMVQGYAGTGKSTMLKSLLDSLETSNAIHSKDIIALAPTHRAVKELSGKGIVSQTVQRFIVDQQENKEKIDNKLIIVDEMSMIGTATFKELTDIVKSSANTKCILLGDNNQLQPVPSGAPSTLAYVSKQADIKHAVIDEIKRQETPHLKEAVSDILSNTVVGLEKSLNTLDKSGSVINTPLYEDGTTSYKDTAIARCAKDYASTAKEDRSNTLIVTPTNKIRHDINIAVRQELIKQGEIKGENIKLNTLIDSGLTNTELCHAKNYCLGDTIKYAKQTGVIQSIDYDANRLIFTTEAGKTKSVSLNDNPIIEKYTREEIVIQQGDTLKWTKTDYEREVLAHSTLSVIDVKTDTKIISVKNEEGKVHDIDLKLSQNKHLGYAYASTIYGSQGATVKNVLCVFDSNSKYANSINAMYVALTRATHSAIVYTQDTSSLIQSIANQKQQEQIALKAFGMLDTKSDSQPQPRQTQQAPKMAPLDATEIKISLANQTQHVCRSLFGEPNKGLSTSQNWRYGSKGALSVFVSGDRQGSFMNFENGVGGDMIKLIMTELGIDFRSALEQASRLVGHVPAGIGPKISQRAVVSRQANLTEIDPKKYDRMKKLVDISMPIKGTVAEKYLKSRGIEPGKLDDIRVIKRVNTGFKNNEIRPFASALLGISKDENGQIKAIQMTYLDPISGKKIDDLPIKKRSMGALKGSVVELTSPPSDPKYCFAAEGIETALSIKNGLEGINNNSASVVATLGISNFLHLDKVTTAKNIVLILDNDGEGASSQKMIDKAVAKLQAAGKTVLTMKPEMIDDKKTDYNDLLKAGQIDKIKDNIERTIDQKEINLRHCGDSKSEQIKHNSSDKREIFG